MHQALADTLKARIFDSTSTQVPDLANCDLLILGTPVEGSSPAQETSAFIEGLHKVEGKKAILFCTYKFFGSGRVFKIMEKKLAEKCYETILNVCKKGMKSDKEADFSEILTEVKKTLEKQ